MAAIWDQWNGPQGEDLQTCSILTTQANNLMKPIHDRMPVILLPDHYDLWLDPTVQNPDEVSSLLKPYNQDDLTAYPISKLVNRPANDTPDCIQSLNEEFN